MKLYGFSRSSVSALIHHEGIRTPDQVDVQNHMDAFDMSQH